VRIVLQQFTLARALRELAQDELHRDSRPRITGFPIIIAGLISIRSVVIAIPLTHHSAAARVAQSPLATSSSPYPRPRGHLAFT
jgi:hypothetical protein